MKFIPSLRGCAAIGLAVLALQLPALNAAGDEDGGAVHQPKTGEFVFSLLPKSLQRNPDLEMTVNTELTPYGRLLRTPSPEQPAYYISYSSGYRQMGEPIGGEHPPKPELIQRSLQRALAVSGYQPASHEHPPELAILYFYGSHNQMDPEEAARFPQAAAKQRLERAMLVGGHAEVDKMSRVLEWGEQLTDRTAKYEYLRDQANDDLYYVVASAYDFAALAHKQRKLVWRTTMTVNAKGVSLSETLSPLIATAGPYFGHETAEPEIVERRISRWGVHVGEGKVIESDVPLPAAGTPGKK